jgi:DNA polymerase-1
MASRDTREPYWKDEGKNQGKGIPKDLLQFWTYNCKDAAVTWELYAVYKARLEAQGKLDFYRHHYRTLYRPVLAMSLRGMRMDEERRAKAFADYSQICTDLKAKLTVVSGTPIYGKKGALSPQKLQAFLYDTLGLKEQLIKDKKTGVLKRTANEIAVRKIMRRYAHKSDVVQVGQWILDHKRYDKLKQFVSEKLADADGRMRSSYSIATITGRFSSSKNAMSTGGNAQNVDREIRDIYLPDPGHLMLEADLSQAESRIVFMLTGDKELVKLARTPPWEYDVHTANAARLYNVPESAVTKTMRYLGKRAVHAGHYGMQGKKLSEIFLLDGYTVPEDEAQKLIDAYLEWRHPIVDVFQKETRQKIMKDRGMANMWGRTVSFEYDRLSDDLYRLGYAWFPQSVVPDIVNQWGIVPLQAKPWRGRHRLHLQGHDSVVMSVRPKNVWSVMAYLKASLERELTYTRPMGGKARALTIPVEFKLSTRWASARAAQDTDVVEWKKPPSEQDVVEAVAHLTPRMVG